MRKLNMWQRLGVVASLLWIVGGGLWQRNSDVRTASLMMQADYEICSERPPPPLPPGAKTVIDKCMTDADRTFHLFLEGSWGNVAIMAFGPILLGWLLAYLVLGVAKWVLAGRKISD